MNDLLSLIKDQDATQAPPDLEAQISTPPSPTKEEEGEEKSMEGFFKEVAAIKARRSLMGEIRRNQGKLSDAHEQSKTITRSAEMRDLREKMQAEINQVSRSAEAIKKRLAELDRNNEAALKKGVYAPGSSAERTRTAITGALKKKLKDLMGEFQDLRTRVNAEYREVVERRVYTVTGQHADEEKIDHMIDTGESETIFQKAILEQGRGYVLDTLAEIRERRDAVMELEMSLMELHQIFLDMAVLVEAQGELLDNIEAQVARSVGYVQAGTNHLQAAKQHQRSKRKWMCCGLITGIIVILIVVLVVIGTTRGFGSS
ncbi:Putative syntaxin-131 [Auxenochlorella protothecoides]|uniref:Putative syntaxin-131 n=1 Tax=Auxenochlorella protothecoides TaxID=3075 RepID=A0A087SNX1_AUXPR|nr:Putative syntaxin-131 [Auxenochlorella protothecoides]KFM27425.1 Putative syntaxin-131 [Auxenochlorella protothecoides]RMZ54125.1 hypothetical protein APUTEX25_005281 [Auxenochlorella protothecoides]|eukprot:RMZ54125.1 hypothetical protein APUTEX25_005281 [Auxenochlorella protothecoides]